VQTAHICAFTVFRKKNSAVFSRGGFSAHCQTLSSFKEELTGGQIGGPDGRVESGGEPVDNRHCHEDEGEAEEAAPQGDKDDGRVEDEVCQRPNGDSIQLV